MARIYLQRIYFQDLEEDSRHSTYLGFTSKAFLKYTSKLKFRNVPPMTPTSPTTCVLL